MATLSNRRAFVAQMLGNRLDLQGIPGSSVTQTVFPSQIDNWLWASYLSIGMRYSFAEAEMSAQGQLIKGQVQIDFPDDARAVKMVTFYRTDGTAIKVDVKNIQYIRQYNSLTQGPPAVIAYYGESILMRPISDNIYTYIIDYWQKPFQSVDGGITASDIGPTEFLVPDDWLEIIDYGAALRGYISILERDKASDVQQLLFGLDLSMGKKVPGLIAEAWTRRQAQAPFMDYGIQPRANKRAFTNAP